MSFYACIIRTADDDILTDTVVAKDWMAVVKHAESAVGNDILEVHMCAIADTDEPTEEMRSEAQWWLTRQLQ